MRKREPISVEEKIGCILQEVKAGIEKALTYCDLPLELWTKSRTNNRIEHMTRELRRRTRAAGAFPDGNSALMLVSRYTSSPPSGTGNGKGL